MDECVRTFTTRGAKQTASLGRAMGEALETGCVIALTGGLGAGKTCFTAGLARGLGLSEDVPVTSPSYTLINEYPCRLILQHVDLYRLEQADLDGIGFFELAGPDSVVAVEWADRLDPGELAPDLTIEFRTPGEGVRELNLRATGQSMVNLLKGLKFST